MGIENQTMAWLVPGLYLLLVLTLSFVVRDQILTLLSSEVCHGPKLLIVP